MSRGQASIEYVLLCGAVVLAVCLLVRFQTPVIAIARGIQHAVAAPAPRSYHVIHGHTTHRKRSRTHPLSCWCTPPGAPD